MISPQENPESIREFVRIVTGHDIRGMVFKRAEVGQEAPGRGPIYSVITTSGDTLLCRRFDSGWCIVESSSNDSETPTKSWFTVDRAESSGIGEALIDMIFAPANGTIEPQFMFNELQEVNGESYEKKVYETLNGMIVSHLKPHPLGRENVLELEQEPPLFIWLLWEAEPGGYDFGLMRSESHPPDWVEPFWLAEEEQDQKIVSTNDSEHPNVTRVISTNRPEEGLSDRAFGSVFESHVQGLFLAHSTVLQLQATFHETSVAFRHYCKTVEDLGGIAVRWSFRSDVEYELADVTALLVREHERHHYQQLMSTPVGLLIWRCLNTITASVEWIVRKLDEQVQFEVDYLPLNDWYLKEGRGKWLALVQEPKFFDRVDRILNDAVNINRFLDAFLNRPKMTLGAFIDLANECQREILRASDIAVQVRWSTRLDRETPYLPEGTFSTTEIIEAAARFEELRLLRSGGSAGERAEESWRRRALKGIYRPAFEFLEERLINPTYCLLALDVALLTPVDPITAEAVNGELIVEDVHPGWRLKRIVDALEQNFWNDDLDIGTLPAAIAESADLCPLQNVLKVGLQQDLIGPISWGADAFLEGFTDEDTTAEYYRLTVSEVKRGFMLRLKDPLMVVGRNGQTHIFRPPFEVWADQIRINLEPFDNQAALLFLKGIHHLIASIVLLSLLSNGDVSILLKIQGSLSATYRELLGEEEAVKYQHLWDVRLLADLVAHDVLRKRLVW